MTAYFDEQEMTLHGMRDAGLGPLNSEVQAWVENLVQDMTLVCEFDKGGPMQFPCELRDAVYKVILKSSGEHWPHWVKGYGVDYEHEDQGMAIYATMVSNLHSLFHSAAKMGWPGRDSPRAPVMEMASRRGDRCEELITADPSLILTP